MQPDVILGKVQLVGAGPGPADLLTLRAARAIEGAQALLYDALVGEDVIALAPAACLKIQTGKRAGRSSMKQETINRLMLRLVRRGMNVVRLKGGDPSIFGRVGEEQGFLRAHGVETEVTPGVTAACAAAAQFGFPLTHRGQARRVAFITATLAAGAQQTDWAAAADPETTLAIYMGGAQGAAVAQRLIAAGRRRDTPVAVIERAGYVDARMTRGVLADLDARMPRNDGGPVLIVVGDVAALAASAEAATERPREGGVTPMFGRALSR